MLRWTHGHSAAAGLLAGLALAHGWPLAATLLLALAVAFAAGLAVGRLWLAAHRARGALAETLSSAERRRQDEHAARVELTRARADEVHARAEAKAAAAAATKRRLQTAVEGAYRRGAEDVLKEQAARNGRRRAKVSA